MRKGSQDPNTTVIATEYGPLVLRRAVAFAEEEEIARSRGRDEVAPPEPRRAADRAA